MAVLALDCSTTRGSVALSQEGERCLRLDFVTGRGQGGHLFAALADAMAVVTLGQWRLEQIVVGLGPGSYSGVRQAIAAATGLAMGTGARLVGAVSAAALEVGADARYQAVGDARRGASYYTAVENGGCAVGPELLETVDALQERLAERVGWPVFAVETLPDAPMMEATLAWPSAERLLQLAESAYLHPSLEPIYLRPVAFTLPREK